MVVIPISHGVIQPLLVSLSGLMCPANELMKQLGSLKPQAGYHRLKRMANKSADFTCLLLIHGKIEKLH